MLNITEEYKSTLELINKEIEKFKIIQNNNATATTAYQEALTKEIELQRTKLNIMSAQTTTIEKVVNDSNPNFLYELLYTILLRLERIEINSNLYIEPEKVRSLTDKFVKIVDNKTNELFTSVDKVNGVSSDVHITINCNCGNSNAQDLANQIVNQIKLHKGGRITPKV